MFATSNDLAQLRAAARVKLSQDYYTVNNFKGDPSLPPILHKKTLAILWTASIRSAEHHYGACATRLALLDLEL